MRHNLTEQNSVLDRIRKGELPAKSSADKPNVPRQEVPAPDKPGIEKPSDPSVKRSETPVQDPPSNVSLDNPVNKVGELIFSDRAKRDFNKGIIGIHLLDDLETAVKMAKIGDVQITYAREDHSLVNTNHAYGLAVDISAFRVDGKFITYRGNSKLFTTLGNIFVEQLKKLGYKFGESPSRLRAYLWQTYKGGNHYNHIHVSNIQGKEKINTADLGSRKENPKFQQQLELKRQLKTHADVLSFFRKYYNWIRDAEKNFAKFTWKVLDWGDDEEGAYEYYNEQVTKGLKAYNLDSESVYNNASKQDKHNIQMIKYIIERIGNLIQQGHQGKYPMTLYIYDSAEKKWKTKKVWFIWDAM